MKSMYAVCLYDTSTGEFWGVAMRLAYITLRGDVKECFLAMGIWKRSH